MRRRKSAHRVRIQGEEGRSACGGVSKHRAHRGPIGIQMTEETPMTKVRVNCYSLSLDGFGAGPKQSLENPLGVGGERLHEWFVPTRTLQKHLFGKDGGETGP